MKIKIHHDKTDLELEATLEEVTSITNSIPSLVKLFKETSSFYDSIKKPENRPKVKPKRILSPNSANALREAYDKYNRVRRGTNGLEFENLTSMMLDIETDLKDLA